MAFGKKGGGGRRSEPRHATTIPVLLMTVTRTSRAVLLDVSSSGARVRCPNPPAVGEELSISIGDIRAFGTVAWVEKDEFGAHFDSPLPAKDLKSMS